MSTPASPVSASRSGLTRSFTGHIAGIGSAGGTRVVVGMWDVSPFGRFADAMIESPDGHRTLVAPTQEIADYVASTYSFDEVVIEPVDLRAGEYRAGSTWSLHTRSLQVSFAPGRRIWVAPVLLLVPAVIRGREWWARLISPIARLLMPGVRTHGSAGGNRTEWYAARDIRRLASAQVTWRDQDLGSLAPVSPPVRFGFASSPALPTVTRLTSYVRDAV